MTHKPKPLIKGWQFYFKEGYGYENRNNVTKALVDFLSNERTIIKILPGHCQLGGKVYGHERFPDGEFIMTLEIEYVARKENFLIAATKSGKKYYFRPDDANNFMTRMINDCKNGAINSKRWFYLPPRMMKQNDKSYL